VTALWNLHRATEGNRYHPGVKRFLTETWMADVVAALEATDAASGMSLRLQQTVTGGPSGDASFWTVFEDGKVSGGAGELADPDVTIFQDYETAVAIARGDLIAQAAFMQGKLKVTGNMGKLLQNQDAIAALGPAMSSIETEF
jgi:putative sterol carrier protein